MQQPSTSRRSLSIAVVLMLVATLVVLLPSASPTGSFGGLVTAAEASNFPAPSMPLPPCDPVTGSGGCVRSQDMSVAVSGQVNDVGSTLTVSGSGLPACVMLYNYEATQTPNPCHTSVGTSVTGCLIVDLWANTPQGGVFGGNCGVTFAESAATSAGTSGSCDGSGNFGTYIYGGPSNVPGATWSERSAGLEANCTLTVTGMPSSGLSGPAWVRISRVASGWSDYYGARESVSAVADAWVPVQVDVRNRGPIVECEAEDLGDGRYRFSVTSIEHPLGLGTDDVRWWFGTGDEGFDETVGSGMSVEYTFDDPSYDWVDWLNVTVTDSDGVSAWCRADRPEPQTVLQVDLERDGDEPVSLEEPFDVDLTVRAPSSNPSDVVGITSEAALVLPDWLELVDGSMPGGFDLSPGDSTTETFTLQATEPGEGTVASTWSGLTTDGEEVAATGEMDVESVGTLGGEWFRKDGLGEYVREGDTVEVRLRVDNESRSDLTEVVLVDAVVVPSTPETGEDSGGGDGEEPPTCPEVPAPVEDPDDPVAPDPGGEGGADGDEGDGAPSATLARAGSSTLRGTLDATGPGSVDFLDFTLGGVSPGDVLLCAEVTATTSDGKDLHETIEATWEVKPVGLDVVIEPHLERKDGSTPELNVDNDGDGDIDDDDHVFDVSVTITNTLDEQITDLHFLDEAEPIDWSNNLIGEDQGAPKLTLLGVRGADVETPDGPVPGPVEPLDIAIPDLAANGETGDSHTVRFVYIATGEVDAEGQSVVLGAQDLATVRGAGEAEIQFLSGVLIEFGVWLKQPTRLTTSGQVVRLGGFVENLDEDEVDDEGKVTREGRDLVVWIEPVTEENAGGGHLVTRDGGRTPIGAERLIVEPGQRLDLHGILTTTHKLTRTDAKVHYLVHAFNKPESAGDTAVPLADERIRILDEEVELADGSTVLAQEEITQRLRFADLAPMDLSACQTYYYDAIVTCNFYEGLVSLLWNTVDAAKMAGTGLGEIAKADYYIAAWSLRQMSDVFQAMAADPAARARLAAELDVQLATWTEMGVMGKDAGVGSVKVLDDFIAESARVLDEGDVDAGLAWISKFAGENPDMLYSFALKARAVAAMGQSALKAEARSAAGSIVREAVDEGTERATREITESVNRAIDQGLDPKKPSSGALRSGLDVTDTPRVWRDVYGAARSDLQALMQVAKEEGILIAFRARNPLSIKLLKDGRAWLKPQSVKAKNVNAIDVTYLGFPQDSFGRVVMMEPPIDFTLTGKALDDALDAHIDVLRKQHPELNNTVYADEVRDRLKLRTTKYQEHLSEWLEFGREGMPVGFDGKMNGVTSSLNTSELRRVRVEIVEVPNRYGPGTLKRFDLMVAGPDGGDFRHLTGDVDIVGFFDLDRTPIMDAARRERIYQKMRATGMQHGETLTWDHKKRAELLREHVGDDAETLLVASPNERLYTSTLDVQKSTAVAPNDNFGDTFSLLDGPPIELVSPFRKPGPPPSGILTSRADQISVVTQSPEKLLLPAQIVENYKKIKAGAEKMTIAEEQSKEMPPVIIRPDGTVVIYSLPDGYVEGLLGTASLGGVRSADADEPWMAEIEDILGGYRHQLPRPAVGALGGRWTPIDVEEALALGTPGVLDQPVMTWTDLDVDPDGRVLSVLTADDLEVPGGDWFAAGDAVVVDPGGRHEQVVRLAAVDGHRMTLTAPVGDSLPTATHVVFLPPSAVPSDSGGGTPVDGGGSSGVGTPGDSDTQDGTATVGEGEARVPVTPDAPGQGTSSPSPLAEDEDRSDQDAATGETAGTADRDEPAGTDDSSGDVLTEPVPSEDGGSGAVPWLVLGGLLAALAAGAALRWRSTP